MAAPIDDILTDLDKKAVLADLYELLGLLGVDVTAFQTGEPVPALLSLFVSFVVDKLWNPRVLPWLRGFFLDYASGDILSLVAALIWNRRRLDSLAATGPIVVENRLGAFFGTIAPGAMRIKSTVTGKTYSNSTAITLAAYTGSGPYPSASATFVADEVGTGSNAQPGDVAAYPTPPVSAPTGVYAQTNAGPLLGSDEETDERLKARAKAAVGELSPGSPILAYASIALDPVGAFVRRQLVPPPSWGTSAPSISRVRVVEPGNAAVTVYLASDSGPAAGDNVTPDTDVFKANVALQAFAKGAGGTLLVLPANAHPVALGIITLTVSSQSHVSAAAASARASSDLDTFDAVLPVGGARKVAGGTGYVYASKILAIAEAGPGVIGADCAFTDTALGVGDVAILSWTIQVNVVDQ